MLGTSPAPAIFSMDARDPARLRRKRKADSHDFSDRERLSKRLSRLNIGEHCSFALYLFKFNPSCIASDFTPTMSASTVR